MDVRVKAKQSFTHGRYNFAKNQEGTLPEAIAKDLAKAGLIVPAGVAEKVAKPTQKQPKQMEQKVAAKPAVVDKSSASSADACTSNDADTGANDKSE